MPAVAIVAGIASGTVVGYVGAAIVAVGMLTESEDMIKVGSLLTAVGGISSAAGSAGTAADAAGSELAKSSATQTAADVASGTGAAGTSSYTGSASELAADGLGGVDSGAGIASQTGTGATVTNVGSNAALAGESTAIGGPTTTSVGSQGVSGSDLVDPGVYNPAGTVNGASPSAANLAGNSGGGLSDTIKGIVNSKEFWNGAMNVVGGAMKGADEKEMNDERLKFYREDLALKQQQAQNANAVPALGNRLKSNPNATPFGQSVAPVYTAPQVAKPYAGIMGAK
jgi:hypothetical protein